MGGCRNINWQSYSESLQHNSAAIKCIKGGRLFFIFFSQSARGSAGVLETVSPPEPTCFRRHVEFETRI